MAAVRCAEGVEMAGEIQTGLVGVHLGRYVLDNGVCKLE